MESKQEYDNDDEPIFDDLNELNNLELDLEQIKVVWMYVEGDTIVRTREKVYRLENPNRLTQDEIQKLWEYPSFHPREVSYFHIVCKRPFMSEQIDTLQPPQTLQPSQPSQPPSNIYQIEESMNIIKNTGIEFMNTSPIYHEYTTVYLMEWLRVTPVKQRQSSESRQNHTRKRIVIRNQRRQTRRK